MNLTQTIEYIYGLNGGIQPTQERFRALLGVLGDPHAAFQSVHVAGTNGKGSTCAFLSGILTAHGKKTGLFTSPYLERFNERMQIDHMPIGDGELIDTIESVRRAAQRIEGRHGPIRPFEAITAAAFLWFAESGVDVAVIETGLGGGGDATNVLDPSHIAITRISHDHTQRLGSRLEDIAKEKAGIIKQNAFVAVHPQVQPVEDVLFGHALQTGCRAHFLKPHNVSVLEDSMRRRAFDLIFGGALLGDVEIPLLGRHQIDNAASAACIALDMGIGEDAIRRGLKRMQWPGRLELFCDANGCVLLDGAHNEGGAQALAEALERYFTGVPKVLVCAVSKDKDIAAMARVWAPVFDGGVVATSCPHLTDAAQTAEHFAAAGARVVIREDAEHALFTARAMNNALVVCAGSLYLVGALRTVLRRSFGATH
ncbi:MAG: bifunctional folylpolyglutamate synthase/dihydrofolate synthase [Bacillota bacterium]